MYFISVKTKKNEHLTNGCRNDNSKDFIKFHSHKPIGNKKIESFSIFGHLIKYAFFAISD